MSSSMTRTTTGFPGSISSRVGSYIATVDRPGQLNLIDAAKGAGVDRFVFVTLSGNMTTDSPLNQASSQWNEAPATGQVSFRRARRRR